MATLRFSRSAQADLLSIGAYTLQTWNASQAERYLDSLEHCAKMLAGNPLLGRRCDWIRPGLYRFEKERHVLFYRREGDGVLVSRILHQSMLPEQQPFEGADPDAERPRSGGS
jgi:toxin ParE1/3/4